MRERERERKGERSERVQGKRDRQNEILR